MLQCAAMKALRQILGFPLLLVQFAVAITGQGGTWLSRMCMRSYYSVCRARRWVVGEPLWKPIDYFNFGAMPRTDAERAELDRAITESFRVPAAYVGQPIDLGLPPQPAVSGEIAPKVSPEETP